MPITLEGIAAIIVALSTALGAVGAIWLNLRGRNTTERQAAVATQVVEDKGQLDTYRDQVHDLTERLERAQDRGDELQDELDDERARRRRDLDEQEVRCRSVVAELTDRAQTLLSIVTDEMSRAALGQQVAAIRPHPHDPLPSLDDDNGGDDDRPDPPS